MFRPFVVREAAFIATDVASSTTTAWGSARTLWRLSNWITTRNAWRRNTLPSAAASELYATNPARPRAAAVALTRVLRGQTKTAPFSGQSPASLARIASVLPIPMPAWMTHVSFAAGGSGAGRLTDVASDTSVATG